MEVIQQLMDLFTGNLTAGLTNLWPLLEPFWSAIIAIAISYWAMMSAMHMATSNTVSAVVGTGFGLVLSGGVIRLLPELIESSIASAGDLAGAGGGGPIDVAPLNIAQLGLDMYSLATNHAGAIVSWGYSGIAISPVPIWIWFAGIIMLAAYALIAILVALALCELLVGALVLSPAYAFLTLPSFSSVAFHPAGHLLSTVFRCAGLSFIASYGVAIVESHPISDMGTEVTLGETATLMAIALFLGLAAFFGDRVVTRALSGHAGFGGGAPQALMSLARGAAGAVGGGIGGAAGAAAAAAGGGGGSRSGGGGGSGGGIGTVSRSPHARRA